MSKTFRYQDEIDDDDDFDENGLLKDGKSARVRLEMRDSAGYLLVDASGRPLPAEGRTAGYVFADANAERRVQDYDFQKAELSSRWKGGLEAGDHLTIGDKRFEILGTNPNNGKLVFADTEGLDAGEIKQQAYNDGVAATVNAWKTRPVTDQEPGDACTTAEGIQGHWRRGQNGKLVCKPSGDCEPSDNEWAMSGPLSDQSDAQAIKDAARLEYEDNLRNAWRK